MNNMNAAELGHFRRLLESRRAALRDVEATGREAAGTVVLDQSAQGRLSRMDAMQRQAMSLEVNRRRDDELRRITAALRRMQEGEYGRCLECDESIARARLEFDPAVTHCIGCANDLF